MSPSPSRSYRSPASAWRTRTARSSSSASPTGTSGSRTGTSSSSLSSCRVSSTRLSSAEQRGSRGGNSARGFRATAGSAGRDGPLPVLVKHMEGKASAPVLGSES